MDLYADLKGDDRDRAATATTRSSTITSLRTNSVINVNDLVLPEDESKTAIFQSAVFVEDGLWYRSIHHRIDPTALNLYRVYYSKPVRRFLGLVIFLNLMLAFIEYPTSLTLSADSRFRDDTWHMPELPCGVTEAVELLCLLVFLLDCSFRLYLIGWKRFIRRPWLVLYSIMIAISFADLIVSLTFCSDRDKDFPHNLPYTLRLRRFCRPLFFLLSSTIMKKFAKAVVLTLPQIFSVLVLLVLHLYVFTMIGLLVFPRPVHTVNSTTVDVNETIELPLDFINASANLSYSYYAELEASTYFDSVSQAFVSLIVLLTTANHPDVMMPIYQYNRFSAIYFILFLGIGTFLILNLLIAATYNQFKGFFQKSMQSSFFRRRVAFRAAFTLLSRKTNQLQQKRGRLSYIQDVVGKDLIRRLLQRARLPSKLLPQMYQQLETVNSQVLNWHQFRTLFDMVSRPPVQKLSRRQPLYGNVRWFQWVQLAIRHRFFNYFTYAVSVVNIILMTVELQVNYEESLNKSNSRLGYYNLFFVVYYVLEQVLKLVGLGARGYFRSFGNLYEGLLTLVLVILEVLVLTFSSEALADHLAGNVVFHFDTVIRVMNIAIVFRLLRIVAHVRSLRILISIVVDLFKNLSGFAGLMAIAYYLFALLGMELFTDVDGPSKHLDNKTGLPLAEICGTYDNLTYYANNFHDFASSLVTLWDVMVVNNWFVILEKFARDSSLLGAWSRLYFIAWWLTAAIIGMNLFVSLVLDTFLIKWEAVHAGVRRGLGGSGGDGGVVGGGAGEQGGMLDAGDFDRFGESSTWEGTSTSTENSVSECAVWVMVVL